MLNSCKLTEAVVPEPTTESAIKGYFSTSKFAVLVTKSILGLSTWPYIWVTRSRTISLRISGYIRFSLMAVIILGFHLSGIDNSFLEEQDVLDIDVASISVTLGEGNGEADEDELGVRDNGRASGIYYR